MPKEDKFNLIQHFGIIHSLTCCGYNGCNRELDEGILVAKDNKLVCPCGKYEQKFINNLEHFKSSFHLVYQFLSEEKIELANKIINE